MVDHRQSEHFNKLFACVRQLGYSDVEYDLGLPEDLFSERYLRNPPRGQLTGS